MSENIEPMRLYGNKEENLENRQYIKKWLKGTRLCLRCGHMFVKTEPKICDCKNPFTVPGEFVFNESVNDLKAQYSREMQNGAVKHIYVTN
jgi:hypothetical protein